MRKLIIVMACGLSFISCNQISKSIDETFKPNDTLVNKENKKQEDQTIINNPAKVNSSTEKRALLSDINTLTKAEEELRKLPQYNGKEIFVYSILYFYDNGIINVMLQHPENPKYVDGYEYRDNKWSEPRPIQLSVKDDIQDRLISLNKISFVNAAKVTAIYNKKAETIEGAVPSENVYIAIYKNQIQWYPTTISGSRERYTIQFNEDGSLKSFKQD